MNTNVPLTLTRGQAAELCGLTPSGFDVWVRKGIVPSPIAGTARWSRVQLERALAGQSWIPPDGAPVEEDEDPYAAYERQEAERDRYRPQFDLNERERHALRRLCALGTSNGKDIGGAGERTFAALQAKGLAQLEDGVWTPTKAGKAEASRYDTWINWRPK